MNSKAHDILGKILENGVDVHRCAAARAMGKIAAPESVGALIKALQDEDSDVRTDAAEALLALGDSAAGEPLMESLIGDPEPDVKKAALQALIALRHKPLLPILRKLVVSRCDDVVWDEDEFYSDGWDSWLDLQLISVRGLARFDAPEAVLDVLAAMADEMGQDISETGVVALAAMGADGAEALSGLFGLSDLQLRRRIADAAVQSANTHTGSLIDKIIGDQAPQVRRIAAAGLPPDDTRLELLFADPDANVRAAVVGHAGQRFPGQVAEMVADPEPVVRTAAFKVIAEHPDLFPGTPLVKSVQKAITGDPGAARHAALALVALQGPSAASGLASAMTNAAVPLEFRVGAVEAMQNAGPVSVPYLLKAVGDEERQLRLAAMTALAGFAADDPIWPNDAGDALLAALNGELVRAPEEAEEAEEAEEDAAPLAQVETDVAATEEEREIDDTMPLVPERTEPANSTLGAIMSGGDAADPVPETPEPVELSEQDLRFLELSKQRKLSKQRMSLDTDVAPHLDVRRFAASLLGEVTNGDVTDGLIAVLDDADADMHEAALASLVQHGEKKGTLPAAALESLTRHLESETPEIRVLATRVLAWVEDPSVEEFLHDHLGDEDPFVRVEAVRALDNRNAADAQIEACLGDEYIGVGIAAATCLARNKRDGAVDALVAFAFRNDGTHRQDVGRLLGTYAPDAGARRLIEVLGDESYRRNWLVAIDALAEVLSQPEAQEERDVA